MIIINIQGHPSHLYKEGSGYYIDYQRTNNNFRRGNRNYIKKVTNSYSINMYFDGINKTNRNVNNQKYSDLYNENTSINTKPFQDKANKYKNLPLNKTHYTKNIGYFDNNESQLKVDYNYFVDRHKFVTKDFVSLNETQVLEYPYPIRFNNSDFYRRGSRIEVFDSIKRIQEYNFGVDNAKGIKGNSLNHGLNALKETVIVKNFTTKSQKQNGFYEDSNILKDVIYNSNQKTIVDNDTQNPGNLINVNVNKISNEPKFVTFNTQKIEPFKDNSEEKRSEVVTNDPNFFYNKLRDSSLNSILVENRNKNYSITIEEEKIYASLGKTIDYSNNIGLESIFYHESLD